MNNDTMFSKYKKITSLRFASALYGKEHTNLKNEKIALFLTVASYLGYSADNISTVILGKIVIVNPSITKILKPLFVTENTFDTSNKLESVTNHIKRIHELEQDLSNEIQHALAFIPNALFISKTEADIYALIPNCFHPILEKDLLKSSTSSVLHVTQEEIDNYNKQYEYYINKAKIKLTDKFLLGETI